MVDAYKTVSSDRLDQVQLCSSQKKVQFIGHVKIQHPEVSCEVMKKKHMIRKKFESKTGLMDVNITALFSPIVRDLSPTSCHRQFHLKLNSFGYDILIGTLFPLIEQIRESLLGER